MIDEELTRHELKRLESKYFRFKIYQQSIELTKDSQIAFNRQLDMIAFSYDSNICISTKASAFEQRRMPRTAASNAKASWSGAKWAGRSSVCAFRSATRFCFHRPNTAKSTCGTFRLGGSSRSSKSRMTTAGRFGAWTGSRLCCSRGCFI